MTCTAEERLFELRPYMLTKTGLFFLYLLNSQKISLMSDVI